MIKIKNNIMNKKFTELAELAKEKGFVPHTFSTNWTNNFHLGIGKNILINEYCNYLLLEEINKWLRDNYEKFVEVQIETAVSKQSFKWLIFGLTNNIYWNIQDSNGLKYVNYEDALLEGLLEAIKIITI